MKTAVIVDSTATPSKQLMADPDFYILRLSLLFAEGDIYEDVSDDQVMHDFYQRLRHSPEPPKTSQPRLDQVYDLFDQLVADGYNTVFVITLAAQISGTYQSVQMVASDYQDRLATYVIDSKGTSFVMENMAHQALLMADAGYTSDEIASKLTWLADQSEIYVVVEDLQFIAKGGRMSTAQAFIGNVLGIKPLIYFSPDGSVQVFDKVRTHKSLYKHWLQIVQSAQAKFGDKFVIALAHGDALKEALAVKYYLIQQGINFPFRIGYLTPVLGVHGGPGAVGLGIMPQIISNHDLAKD
ncbi:DegV family protein [Eremococcus coleocola]|uniref:DegV family protein n=1 Tax=Eremococcus coleocola TaxID=88132 RepID=UPI00041DCBDB|nr:DegV family protein [Eremococcus coleocola]